MTLPTSSPGNELKTLAKFLETAEETTTFQLMRDGGVRVTKDFLSSLKEADIEKECWLFVVPHDDDLVLGLSTTLLQAHRLGIPYRVIIVTDGQNGYATDADAKNIVQVREQETSNCFRALGLTDLEFADIVKFLGLPDCNLQQYLGEKLEKPLTAELRTRIDQRAVNRVFTVSESDYHLDHSAVVLALKISIFHSLGEIWLGDGASPLKNKPVLYQACVYCPFANGQLPTHINHLSQSDLEKKLSGISAFRSQRQITALVKSIRDGPKVEVLLESEWLLYNPEKYLSALLERS